MAVTAYHRTTARQVERSMFNWDDARKDVDPPDADVADADLPDASTDRPVFRYSVIPGGAYDARELDQAIDRDPIVAAEYSRVAASGVHAEVVSADQMAYMSYRMDGRIYWTKHTIKLRRGETILTNGEARLRGRCGNGISLEPMEPTAPAEPAPMELEGLAPGQPPLLSAHRLAYDLASPGGLSSGMGLGLPGMGSGFTGPFLDSNGLFAGGGLVGLPPSGPSGVGSPDVPQGAPPLLPGAPPGFPGPPPTFPGEDPIIHQIIDNPPDGPKTPTVPGTPDTPIPTPEPATMLLVGGGLVSLSMALRKKRNADPQEPTLESR
jgi:hypothetical protein